MERNDDSFIFVILAGLAIGMVFGYLGVAETLESALWVGLFLIAVGWYIFAVCFAITSLFREAQKWTEGEPFEWLFAKIGISSICFAAFSMAPAYLAEHIDAGFIGSIAAKKALDLLDGGFRIYPYAFLLSFALGVVVLLRDRYRKWGKSRPKDINQQCILPW